MCNSLPGTPNSQVYRAFYFHLYHLHTFIFSYILSEIIQNFVRIVLLFTAFCDIIISNHVTTLQKLKNEFGKDGVEL